MLARVLFWEKRSGENVQDAHCVRSLRLVVKLLLLRFVKLPVFERGQPHPAIEIASDLFLDGHVMIFSNFFDER